MGKHHLESFQLSCKNTSVEEYNSEWHLRALGILAGQIIFFRFVCLGNLFLISFEGDFNPIKITLKRNQEQISQTNKTKKYNLASQNSQSP